MPNVTFLPKRLNEPPVVFRGMTEREVALVALLGFGAGLPLGGISAWVLGRVAMVPTVAAIIAGATLWFGGTVMRRLRRGRPTLWFYRHLQWKLASMGFPLGNGADLITRSQVYRIVGRDRGGRR